LKRILVAGDAIALFSGFGVPVVALAGRQADSFWYGLIAAVVIATIGLWAVHFQGLWLDRVLSVRAIEVSRVGRALVMVAIAALVLDRKSPIELRAHRVAIGIAIGWGVFVLWRSAYRAVLAAERRHGRLLTRVILIGTERRAAALFELLGIHSDLGMRVVAVVGDRREADSAGMGNLWRAEYLDAGAVVGAIEADAVILCSADIDPALARSLTRSEHQRHRAVYVDPGLSGFDIRRFQATHVAHQPLLEVESMSLARLQQGIKRLFDIIASGLMLLLAAPILLVIAAMIKAEDRGPVLFRQERVGYRGRTFGILKFRTMVTDAEQLLARLENDNERTGPLFKMEVDPRVTRIGRFLRATSLDELPQLLNVLQGTMSLVGPRPALPKEVNDFDDVLRTRDQVRPGITGLWQVEARDNPAFAAYRRLDLFYVENWSLALDMIILLATLDQILFRPIIKWGYKGTGSAPASPGIAVTPT
jgi:exopolysaccharide biosynthesis polyprenyl glycosylphosphotransferase